MDLDKWTVGLMKWFRNKNTMAGLAGVVVIVLVLYADFSYWAGAVIYEPDDVEIIIDDNATLEPTNFTFMTERALDASGSTTIASITGVITVDEPFEVKDNAARLWVNLTGDMENALRDYDLQVLDPEGNEIGRSGNQGSTESVTVDEKTLGRIGAGTFTARIVVFHGRFMSYQVTGDVMYKIPDNSTECEDDVCPA